MSRPFLNYSGQTTAEILAAADTHRLDSLLYALEEGLQRRGPEYTPAERLLLGVLAFESEVNNGGFAQFFVNSSRQYAPDIVGFLLKINAPPFADLARRALELLGADPVTPESVREAIIREDPSRDEALNQLDQEFYQMPALTEHLWRFVRDNTSSFVLHRTAVAPPPAQRGISIVTHLELALAFDKPRDMSFESLRKRLVELAAAKSITATDAEFDGGVYLYLFTRHLKDNDLAGCAEVAPRAFELCREDTGHCVCHRKWIEQLLAAARDHEADLAARQYLEYLHGDDRASYFIRKRVGYFAAIVRPNAAHLPEAAAFLDSHFTEDEIESPAAVYSNLREAIRANLGPPAKQ